MKRILLLYTGGTIGSEGAPLAPMVASRFAQQLIASALLPDNCELRALPSPLDSASMRPADWLDIAAALLDAWVDFDGFVVLHGTDTLAYTASALSFLLVGMDKPVVLTGSQHPLAAARSDAPYNLTDAIAAARAPGLREVAVCFAGRILRGNRCIKRSASDLDAFASPNWPALGEVKDGVALLSIDALSPTAKVFDPAAAGGALDVMRAALAERSIWAIQLHPGFPAPLLQAALDLPPAPRGWVLACYGSGNAPQDADFLAALHAAQARGMVVVAVTQTGHGAVNLQTYAAGAGLAQAGVVSGRDLTLPAALTKLQLLLARNYSRDEVVAKMSQSLAGEIS